MTKDLLRYREYIRKEFLPPFDHASVQSAPFLPLIQTDPLAGWSAEMSDFLEESSDHHFIDIYNRGLIVRGLKTYVAKQDCNYLDVGCSSGHMLRDMKTAYPHAQIAGCDYEANALAYCNKRYPDFPLFQVDLTHCPFQDNSFDVMTCLNVLEHIEDDTRALSELYRILKPGGAIGITVPLEPKLYDLYDEVHHHCRRYAYNELLEKVRGAGFGIKIANRFGVMIYPAFYCVKRLNQWRYKNKTFTEKYNLALKQAIATKSPFTSMNLFCRLEEYVGQYLPYPRGVRGYAIAIKPKFNPGCAGELV